MPAALACPACRTQRISRRGDPLCAICTQRARETVPRPLWLFDSPLLRRALADLNVPAVPAIVRAACDLSQRDLAGVVGWSPAALSYYERGQRDAVFDVRTLLQFADAVGMPRAALLPLIVADPNARLVAGDAAETTMAVDRRRFGGLVAGAAAVLPLAGVSSPTCDSRARYWEACAEALYVRDRMVGGAVLLLPALRQWQLVRRVLPETGRADHKLLAAAGDLALCTGWIALDGGHPPMTWSLYGQARELANASGDAMVAVHALTNLSMLHAEMARTGSSREPARRSLRLAFQAAEEARYLAIPRLHALIALRQASAASLLGDKAAFEAGIARARRELNRGPRDDAPSEWLRFVDSAEVTGVEAQGYLNLGHADRSVVLYRQVLAAGLSPRNRASYGAGLADALLRQGARHEAVAAAMDVLPMLEDGVTSIRCVNRLRLVRQMVVSTGEAEEFCERLDAIERTLAAPSVLPGDDAADARADVPALQAVFDVASKHCPGLRADGEAGACRVLRVADQAARSGLGDLDAVVASGAAAGLAPWAGQCRVLRGGHGCSLASVRIIAADSAGSRAWVTRWVQARVNRSTSSPASRYTSPMSPST